MGLGLNRGEEEGLQFARVNIRAVDEDGKPIGIPSNNTILESRQYKTGYAYGNTAALTANIIAENLMEQVDEHWNRHLLIDKI